MIAEQRKGTSLRTIAMQKNESLILAATLCIKSQAIAAAHSCSQLLAQVYQMCVDGCNIGEIDCFLNNDCIITLLHESFVLAFVHFFKGQCLQVLSNLCSLVGCSDIENSSIRKLLSGVQWTDGFPSLVILSDKVGGSKGGSLFQFPKSVHPIVALLELALFVSFSCKRQLVTVSLSRHFPEVVLFLQRRIVPKNGKQLIHKQAIRTESGNKNFLMF